jgi:hypothetical protein
MDVVVIFNGLGNQMSQYALFLQKKKLDQSTQLISFCADHNGFELDSVFNISWKRNIKERLLYVTYRILLTEKRIIKPIQFLFSKFQFKIVNENYDYSFKREYLSPSKGITFYVGGWHSDLYFSEARTEVKRAFQFKQLDDEQNRALLSKILNGQSVALHVRRGDYMNEENLKLFGRVCTDAYFQKAIATMIEKVPDAHFYVFSNDLKWVKENLRIERVTYVDHNSGKDSWKDMYLMSKCKHNVISNSTFSWWGAWLNDNPEKIIISPTKFLNDDLSTDVYPQEWLKISEY